MDNVQETMSETVERTFNLKDDWGDFDMMHGVLGVTGETGELADAVKKHQCYGRELDKENVKEELGDLLYYIQVVCNCTGTTLEECAQMNRDKLQKRYPNGFTTQASIDRADKS